MLAEQYIPGREFTVGILGNGQDIHVFEPMEIVYLNRDVPYQIYTFEVKQNYQKYIRYDCPADIPASFLMKKLAPGMSSPSALRRENQARHHRKISLPELRN